MAFRELTDRVPVDLSWPSSQRSIREYRCRLRAAAVLIGLTALLLAASCDTSLSDPDQETTGPDDASVVPTSTGTDVTDVTDVSSGASTDVTEPPDAVNACGGVGELLLGGEVAGLLEAYGAFDEGAVVCDGPGSLRCAGQAAVNACGSVGVLPGAPGTECGCGGTWICDQDGGLTCRFGAQLNPCGGCEVLQNWPGSACEEPELGDGVTGTWVCAEGGESTSCVEGERNACGGQETLVLDGRRVRPGDACQAGCGFGVWVCDGEEAVRCAPVETPENACGGCGLLPGVEGGACGCGGSGSWVCRADGTMACEGAQAINACGGCGGLEAAPGTACGVQGQSWACVGEQLVCGPGSGGGQNTCGGDEPLAGEPGAPCGECGLGEWRCEGASSVACEGDRQNACGGCGVLPAGPGARCGECGSGTQVCGADGESLTCAGDTGEDALNACGGCGPLPGVVGGACGECREWRCDGTVLRCTATPEAPGCDEAVGCDELEPSCADAQRRCVESDGVEDAFCGSCLPGWGRCASGPGPCDVHLAEDPDNCGECGRACGNGGTCEAGVCLGVVEPGGDCSADAECVDGASCAGGRCVRDDGSCQHDGECPDDLVCGEGRCVACAVNADCDGSWRCSGGECVECVTNSHCSGDFRCQNGSCVPPTDCPSGQVRCGGQCRAPNACGGCASLAQSPGASCGECGTVECHGTEEVRCVDPGSNACGGCSTLAGQPGASCGECGTWACNGPGLVVCSDPGRNACGGCATLANPPGASCGPCGADQYECNGNNNTVCSGSSTNACGGCGNYSRSIGSACGTCGEWACSGTSWQCVGSTNTQTDPLNCGACGNQCDGGRPCVDGSCGCPSGEELCGSTCVDLQTSDAHCGTCGNACTGGRECSGGGCSCPTGQTFCQGACVSLQNDDDNCGSCGNACGTGQTCQSGQCVCTGNQVLCEGVCREADACGGCGSIDVLPGDRCGYCNTGTWTCGGGVDDGISCEGATDPMTDSYNCGSCGVTCDQGFCWNGWCNEID